MAISQIPTLRAHIWETKSWQIYPPPNSGNFTDSNANSSQLADQVLADPPLLSPGLKWQFHRFLLWELIFGRPGLGQFHLPQLSNSDFTYSSSENSYLAGQVWTYLPQSPTVISQIPTLIAHICQTRSWHIFHPPTKQWFHRFLLWEFIFGRPGLGRSISPLEYSFYRFLLWEFIFE